VQVAVSMGSWQQISTLKNASGLTSGASCFILEWLLLSNREKYATKTHSTCQRIQVKQNINSIPAAVQWCYKSEQMCQTRLLNKLLRAQKI